MFLEGESDENTIILILITIVLVGSILCIFYFIYKNNEFKSEKFGKFYDKPDFKYVSVDEKKNKKKKSDDEIIPKPKLNLTTSENTSIPTTLNVSSNEQTKAETQQIVNNFQIADQQLQNIQGNLAQSMQATLSSMQGQFASAFQNLF